MNWEQLKSLEDLDRLQKESLKYPVLIYKHSTRCSISAATLNRLERNWDEARTADLKTYFLDLLSYRHVSSEIAKRFGVEHESPQVLLVWDGRCVYAASHFGINFEDIVQRKDSLVHLA